MRFTIVLSSGRTFRVKVSPEDAPGVAQFLERFYRRAWTPEQALLGHQRSEGERSC